MKKIPNLFLNIWKSPRILLYHGVCEKEIKDGIQNYRKKHITKKDFEEQIKFLKKRFKIVPLTTIVSQAEKGMLAITFDDGYRNVYQNAYPILKELQIPFSLFLPINFIEKKEPLWVDRIEHFVNRGSFQDKIEKDKELREFAKTLPEKEFKEFMDSMPKEIDFDKNKNYAPLEWQEINQMVFSGLAEIGSHTLTHIIATQSEDFERELVLSKEMIWKRLNINTTLFAYPNGQLGDYSEKTAEILKETGFKIALTTEHRFFNKDNKLAIPRLGMDDQSLFLFTVSGLRAFLRKARDLIREKQSNAKEFLVHFNEKAITYADDYGAESQRGHSFRQRKKIILGLIKKGSILDIGCGPGVYTKELLEQGFEVFGIDNSPEMIKKAKTKFPDAFFKVMSVEKMDFADNYFDTSIASGLIEYLDNPAKAIKEIARVSKEVVMSFPYKHSLPRIWDKFIVSSIGRIIKLFIRKPPKLASKEFSLKTAIRLMEQQGLKVNKIIFFNSKILWTPLDRMFPKLAMKTAELIERLPLFKTAFILRAKK